MASCLYMRFDSYGTPINSMFKQYNQIFTEIFIVSSIEVSNLTVGGLVQCVEWVGLIYRCQ